MWVRGAAIRPVPRYAVVASSTLDAIERELADDSARSREELDGAFARFEASQPNLADTVSQALSQPLDETALALGYFLSISIFLAFERTFGDKRLREVSADALAATEQAIALEEELRAAHGDEPLDLDDVVSIEQPHVLAFVHEHVDAALDPKTGAEAAASAAEPRDVDVDDVHGVYRAIVLLTLCLSHAVVPVDGASRGRDELMA
ncbi:MAG TPA: hypothetical protein VHS09_01025 [Polyangiaceae bacterium]|jgi:hypothetical protein|nr:hypothetical protein [Polyangiaceae bacterium]